MKRIIKYSIIAILAVFVFTGCGCKEPEIKIIEKTKVEFIEPDVSNYTYVDVPTLDIDTTNMTVDEALDYIIEYSLKQQTVIQEYEARIDSLNKWVNEVKLKQKEIREKEKK